MAGAVHATETEAVEQPSWFIESAAFAPPRERRLIRGWDRAPVAARAPRLLGQKVWKKVNVKSAHVEDRHDEEQEELLKEGGGARKRARPTGARENISNAIWADDASHATAKDMMTYFAHDENEFEKENLISTTSRSSTLPTKPSTHPEVDYLPRKRTHNDHVITPRKPLRQTTLNKHAQAQPLAEITNITPLRNSRARKSLRKSSLGCFNEDTQGDRKPRSQPRLSNSVQHQLDVEITTSTIVESHEEVSVAVSSQRCLRRSTTAKRRSAANVGLSTEVDERKPEKPSTEPIEKPVALITGTSVSIIPQSITESTLLSEVGSGLHEDGSNATGTATDPASNVSGKIDAVPAHLPENNESNVEALSFENVPVLSKEEDAGSEERAAEDVALEDRAVVDSALEGTAAEDTAAEAITAGNTTSEEAAPKDRAAEDVVLEDLAAEGLAAEDTAAEAIPAEATATKDTILEDTATEDTAPEEKAVEDTTAEDTAIEGTAAKDTAVEDTATEDTIVEDKAPEVTAPKETAIEDTAEEDTAPQFTPSKYIAKTCSEVNVENGILEPEAIISNDTEQSDGLLVLAIHNPMSPSNPAESFQPSDPVADQKTSLGLEQGSPADGHTASSSSSPTTSDYGRLEIESVPAEVSVCVEDAADVVADPDNPEHVELTPAHDHTAVASTEMQPSTVPVSVYEHDDTDMLRNFLTRVKANKAAKNPSKRKRSLPHSPLQIPLGDLDNNISPSPQGPSGDDDITQTSPSKRRKRGAPLAQGEEVPEPRSCRRSTRTRIPPKDPPEAPSFIPVRRLGQEVDNTVNLRRNEEKELAALTRVNTRKNKGLALTAPEVLAMKAEERDNPALRQRLLKEVFDEKMDKSRSGKDRKGRDKKIVTWAEELAQFQALTKGKACEKAETKETEKEKEKEKAAVGGGEQKKKGAVRLGVRSKAGLGMALNGTPAPKRKIRGRG